MDVAYTANGLNQYTQVNANAYSYDANGNLVADGTDSFVYDPANRLVAMPSKGATLAYDPLGRLHSVTNGSGTVRFLYDGDALIMELNAGGGILASHVHGLSAGDDPLASYTGSNFDGAHEQLIRQDRLGSVLMMSTDRSATTVTVNTYDEYGVPGSGNVGRFQYTGQVWLPQLGLYHYKARTYSPTLGRFLQTDPTGYGDGFNMYAYVGNDPVNGVDPSGLSMCDPVTGLHCSDPPENVPPGQTVTITADRCNGVWVGNDWAGYACVNRSDFVFDLADYNFNELLAGIHLETARLINKVNCSVSIGVNGEIGAGIGPAQGYLSAGFHTNHESGLTSFYATFRRGHSGFGLSAGGSLNAGGETPEAGVTSTRNGSFVFGVGGAYRENASGNGESSGQVSARGGLRFTGEINETTNYTAAHTMKNGNGEICGANGS